ERADRWANVLSGGGGDAHVVEGQSTVGGGTLPGETLPTALCAISSPARSAVTAASRRGSPAEAVRSLGLQRDVADLARLLRIGEPPIVGRVLRDTLLLDPRTVQPEEEQDLLAALQSALARW